MCNLGRKTTCQWIFFSIFVILEVVDLVSDWRFYIEMSKQERGIVFGPIDKRLLCATLAFCFVGITLFSWILSP